LKTKTLNLLVAVFVILGLLMTAQPVSAKSTANNIFGTVSAVADSTVTITPKKGGPDVVLNVDDTTSIRRGNRPTALSNLQVGDRIAARYEPTTMLATTVRARANLVVSQGVVMAVDTTANTVTIKIKKGWTTVVLQMDGSTLIRRKGHPAALADLKVGDRVVAKYNRVSLLAVAVRARAQCNGDLVGVKGTISAVDTTASTVTITPKDGGPDVTLTVDANTVIMRGEQVITLADLVVGEAVKALYDPVTLLAVKIKVEEVHTCCVEGTIKAIDIAASTVTITTEGDDDDDDGVDVQHHHDEDGQELVLIVDSSTVITRAGQPITLADLKVGDRVEAEYYPTTLLAVKIEVKVCYTEIKGTISAVDTAAGTVTVTPKDGGADMVFTVNSSTVFRREDQPITLADLKVGDQVEVEYDPATMVAAEIEVELACVEGTISVIDLATGAVTIVPDECGTEVTVKVDSNTVIERDHQPITLADLKVGDRVDVEYDPVSMIAVKIEVEGC